MGSLSKIEGFAVFRRRHIAAAWISGCSRLFSRKMTQD